MINVCSEIPVSIFWGCLPFEVIFVFKLKIWLRSDKWLLRYSSFNILRLSSIWGCFHFRQISILVWFQKLKLKFEEGPMYGCCDIPVLIFGGRLPFEVIFISFDAEIFHFQRQASGCRGYVVSCCRGYVLVPGDNNTALWPILQADSCQIFS
jgi:hypothetical protein